MEKFQVLTSNVIPLVVNDIDTDQIIPARYLKVTDKTGLGANLFADWRYLTDGSPNPNFIFNKPEFRNSSILLAGDNFGCGSSREHAPWALTNFGIKAVISTSFADIFRNNALKNGLLPIIVDPVTHQKIVNLIQNQPQITLTIDLATQSVIIPVGEKIAFPIDEFSKICLLNGTDELGYLMTFLDKIRHYEQKHNLA